MMKTIPAAFLCLWAVAAARGQTVPAGSAPADSAADPKVLEILKLLEARDRTLQDFTAKVRKEDTNVRLSSTEVRAGTAAYEKIRGQGGKDVVKLGMHFDSFKVKGMPPSDPQEDFVVNGRWFIHRDTANKQFTKIELVPPDQDFNPLKIGVSPIPLPIGQDPQEILRNFDVTSRAVEAKDVPAGYDLRNITCLRLVPKKQGKYDFQSVDLFVDKPLELPVKIATVGRDDNPTTFVFSEVKINQGGAKILDLATPEEPGWKIEIRPHAKSSATAPAP